MSLSKLASTLFKPAPTLFSYPDRNASLATIDRSHAGGSTRLELSPQKGYGDRTTNVSLSHLLINFSVYIPKRTLQDIAMPDKDFFLRGIQTGEAILVDDPRLKITPQPEPTSPRIKELLSKGLMASASMTPAEIQEMTAAIVYHLIMRPKR